MVEQDAPFRSPESVLRHSFPSSSVSLMISEPTLTVLLLFVIDAVNADIVVLTEAMSIRLPRAPVATAPKENRRRPPFAGLTGRETVADMGDPCSAWYE